MDRRIQKTRQLIISTFVELLSVNKFEKITINDIAKHANVNRGTVYLHFADKYDLLDKCIETYTRKLMQYCEEQEVKSANYNVLLTTFEYLRENFIQYKILMTNEGIGYFRKSLYSMIASKVATVVVTENDTSGFSKEITVHFLTSAFVGVVEWWLVNSMPCSIEEVTKQLWAQASLHQTSLSVLIDRN
ncbi:TetR/AcrR family transcriptional regulator [Clostridium intestinale]|uniref:TetR/AcrR family transcriptional regulator n=1 Tax=Clostridium intestinale TaxID=36845 RepID=UPI002DD63C9A|nr:TetR/AcrR family transcriptional regulator [Clostridium intestinale]WRY51656.1 TetR/AcrR family transcriptional regulator [Clostridium intestinale]